jgi:hypothetical protein
MVTLGITFTMGILGLVVDVGWGYYRKQVAQTAVDAAVLAAAVQAANSSSSTTFTCGSNGIVCQGPTSCASTNSNAIINAACLYGKKNGVAGEDLMISANVTSLGNGASVSYWVKASVNENLTLGFSKILGVGHGTVGAAATGGVVVQNGSGGGCIYSLDPGMAASLQVGASSLTTSCGVYVNSNDSAALKVNGGNSFIEATGGSGVNIVGGWTCTNGCSYIHPTPVTGVEPASDPLADLPPVAFSGCDRVNFTQTSTGASTTLNPGVYCGGIKVSGGTVTFNPGTYVLNGGGLSFQGTGTTINGNGVFFYNTSAGYTVGNLAISGSPSVTLTAPTSGTYQGILYYRDRNVCPSTNDAVTGNTNTVLSGTFYVHCANSGGNYVPAVLMFSGQSTPGHYVALVADTIKITGNSNLILDPTGGSNTGLKSASKVAQLIE